MFDRRVFIRLGMLVLAVGAMVGTPNGCCEPQPNPGESLKVALHPQETSMWCWAASGQMVMDYLGHDVEQCVQANNRFGRNDCCSRPTPESCVLGGWPEFGKYNFSFNKTTDVALNWGDLRIQVSTGRDGKARPFCFTWHWSGGGGHMMVVCGYKTEAGVNWVEILDPGPPNVGDHRFITYERYVSGSYYTHWDDYYDVTYIGGQ